MPCDYSEYPPDWKERRKRILKRANYCCEVCGALNHCYVGREDRSPCLSEEDGVYIILTIAHLDHDHDNWDVTDDRLMAMCQMCHNGYDAKHRAENRRRKQRERDKQMELI